MRIAFPLLAVALAAALAAAPASTPAAALDPGVRRALPTIRGDALRGHMRFLADDLLEGRGTASRGYDIAARYVAAQFEAAGLEPGGERGSWLQTIPLRRLDADRRAARLALVRGGRERLLVHDTDYLIGSDPVHAQARVDAPLAFAGFGITAPELTYDDYAHVDVKGKVVVLLSGAPPTFPPDQRAYYSSNLIKNRLAAAKGAIGIITVRTPVDEARGPWERSVLQSRLPGMRWLDRDGVPSESHASLQLFATMSRPGARALFAGSPVPLARVFATADSGRAQGFDLAGTRVRAATRTRHRRVSSPNVVGMLEGGDPRLRGEYVVYTAHLDHLGIGAPVKGDSIHNGAYDNATGIGALIEVARAFAALPKLPRRSILFVAVTAEEKGLQGSDYFARMPTVAKDAIVANINMDMFLMLEEMPGVIVFGGEHSSLGPMAERAARAVGLAPTPDPSPEEVVFIRSDQFPFVRQGVPAVFPVLTGANRVAPGDSLSPLQRWRRTVYHSPQDEMGQPMHFESGAKFIRMQFVLGHEVANAAARPTWNRGDFFGEMFAGDAGGLPPRDAALANVRWRPVSMGGRPVTVAAAAREPWLQLDARAGRVSGLAGCNRFSGPYTAGPGTLRFGPLVATKMACPELETEAALLRALEATRGFRVLGRTLELVDAGGRVLVRLEERSR